jgi:hypothetical protein
MAMGGSVKSLRLWRVSRSFVAKVDSQRAGPAARLLDLRLHGLLPLLHFLKRLDLTSARVAHGRRDGIDKEGKVFVVSRCAMAPVADLVLLFIDLQVFPIEVMRPVEGQLEAPTDLDRWLATEDACKLLVEEETKLERFPRPPVGEVQGGLGGLDDFALVGRCAGPRADILRPQGSKVHFFGVFCRPKASFELRL